MIAIGIDPGITGAVALINDTRQWSECWDCPTKEAKSGRRVSDPAAMAALLRQIKETWIPPRTPAVVVIEDLQPMPKNGSIANYSLGRNLGLWEGIIEMSGLRIIRVKPRVWNEALFGKPAKKYRAPKGGCLRCGSTGWLKDDRFIIPLCCPHCNEDGLPVKSDTAKKKASLKLARELFPCAKDDLKLEKHHGRAEALLIAEYGLRQGGL